MAREPDAVSRMEILVLCSLARGVPMHGYEIKTDLRYKHVRWWAKCDHGHLYGTLARLEQRAFVSRLPGADRRRRVYTLTDAGRQRLVDSLEHLGGAPDETYFDIDLFLSGAFALEQDRVLEILATRREHVAAQLEEAEALASSMSPYVPAAGRLIMEHRLDHLRLEAAFLERAATAFRTAASWGSFLGTRPIDSFVRDSGVPLEVED